MTPLRRRGRPLVMGILNLTPDSFSDGGMWSGRRAAEHAFEMVDAGADIIDVGAESTRPGSRRVPADEELRRLLPVLREVAPSCGVPVSVDTMKAEVAAAALDAGAGIVNDVLGLRGEGMMELVASAGVPAVVMHMHGTPETMQLSPMQGDAAPQVSAFFEERTAAALDAGMRAEDIVLDPGVGFGKTCAQNLEVIDCCGKFGHPVLIGASRKRFLSEAYPGLGRDEATVRVGLRAARAGADILRVHDVASAVRSLEQAGAQGEPGDRDGGKRRRDEGVEPQVPLPLEPLLLRMGGLASGAAERLPLGDGVPAESAVRVRGQLRHGRRIRLDLLKPRASAPAPGRYNR